MAGYIRYRDGAWRIRVEVGTDPLTGARRQIHATVHGPNNKAGRKLAEDRQAHLVVQAAAGRIGARTRLTVAELLELYITDRAPNWSPGSAEATRRRVAQHITPHLGGRPADKITPADIRALHRRWDTEGLSRSTAGRLHDILRAAYRRAVRDETVHRDPTVPVDRPVGQATTVIPPPKDLVVQLIQACGATLALYLRLAALTGARRGTLLGLQWRDIDLDHNEITFRRSIIKVPGGWTEKIGSKTGRLYRVSIDPVTARALKAMRVAQVQAALAIGVQLLDDAWLFSREPDGTAPWYPDGVNLRIRNARRRLERKLSTDDNPVTIEAFRPHDLRHWMATTMLEEDLDVVTLAGRGGWSDPNMPLQKYAHFSRAKDAQAATALARVLDAT